MQFDADADLASYQDFDSENFEDTRVTMDLKLDLRRASALNFIAEFRNDHVDRQSPDDIAGIAPTLFDVGEIEASFAHRGARLNFLIKGKRQALDFHDVLSDQGVLDNDYRDRTITTTTLRTGYEVNPDLDVFLQVNQADRDYDAEFDDLGFNRDSDSLNYGVGVAGSLTGTTFARVLIGYAERGYHDPNLVDIDTPWFDAQLMWNISNLTSVTLAADRDIRETTFDESSGYIVTNYSLRVDHELRRNLLLLANINTSTHDYKGIQRNDDIFGFNLGARYLVNRSLQIALQIRRRERESNSDDIVPDDFSKLEYSLTFRIQR